MPPNGTSVEERAAAQELPGYYRVQVFPPCGLRAISQHATRRPTRGGRQKRFLVWLLANGGRVGRVAAPIALRCVHCIEDTQRWFSRRSTGRRRPMSWISTQFKGVYPELPHRVPSCHLKFREARGNSNQSEYATD